MNETFVESNQSSNVDLSSVLDQTFDQASKTVKETLMNFLWREQTVFGITLTGKVQLFILAFIFLLIAIFVPKIGFFSRAAIFIFGTLISFLLIRTLL